MRRNILLKTQYDGTDFCGWQSQKNGRAVQDVLQRAIFDLTGENVNLTGCSRTDAGVHALSHVSNFFTESTVPGDKFTYALNTYLPTDLSVIHSEEVPESFNARFCTKGKRYKYRFQTGEAPQAIWSRYAYFVHGYPDAELMARAAAYFEGEHDFSSFVAAGGETKTTVRNIYSCKVNALDDGIIEMDIYGNGFLYNMVRIIAGTVLYVGLGKLRAENIPHIILSCDRVQAGKTLSAKGLMLCEVYY